MHLFSFAFLFLGLTIAANCGPFTSLVNLEKLYTLEDELITIADVILKQEKYAHDGVDVHNIENLESIVEKVKDIHRKVGGENMTEHNMTQYIVHPINVFHLVKRLIRVWPGVVKTLRDSHTCIMPMRVKVQNIEDNLPMEERLMTIAKGIINLQNLYDASVEEIVGQSFFRNDSIQPLSLDDKYFLARAAYEAEDFNLAVDWLLRVTADYIDGTGVDFSLKNVLNLLSSAYFKLKRPNDALFVLEKILEIDPENKMAQRNKKFMSETMEPDQEDKPRVKTVPKKRKDQLTQQLCTGKIEKTKGKQSQLKCTYVEERKQHMFTKPSIQAEIINFNPLIVIFHNFTNNTMQKNFSQSGLNAMRDSMYSVYYRNPEGIEATEIYDFTNIEWMPELQLNLENIHLTNLQPGRANIMVRNIGMEGYTSSELPPAEGYYLGSFLVFILFPFTNSEDPDEMPHFIWVFTVCLSEVKRGGEIVFPFSKTKANPEKGAVLFFEKKAHKQMSICPVIMDTEWLGVYPLYDTADRNVCFEEKVIKPSLS